MLPLYRQPAWLQVDVGNKRDYFIDLFNDCNIYTTIKYRVDNVQNCFNRMFCNKFIFTCTTNVFLI